jgi:Transthyretin-like family
MMEQRQEFFSGIPAPDIDPEALGQALQNVLRQATESGPPALEMLGWLQQRQADRLDEAAQMLRKKLGSEHPDVVAIENQAKAAVELKSRFEIETTRLKRWPKVRANEWVVFGTVLNAEGRPARELTVRVFDQDRKYDDLLGETTTDEAGDFAVTYHERDFAEIGEGLPELYLRVEDNRGRLLYSSRASVRYEAGRIEFFRITLGAAPSDPVKAKPAARPKAAPKSKRAKSTGKSS